MYFLLSGDFNITLLLDLILVSIWYLILASKIHQTRELEVSEARIGASWRCLGTSCGVLGVSWTKLSF